MFSDRFCAEGFGLGYHYATMSSSAFFLLAVAISVFAGQGECMFSMPVQQANIASIRSHSD